MTGLHDSFQSSQTAAVVAVQNLESCCRELKAWMAANILWMNPKPNDNKIEAVETQQSKVSVNSICVGECEISRCSLIRDPGLLIDSNITLHHIVSAVVRTCYFHLRTLGKLRPFLTKTAFISFAVALVLIRLDDCNSCLWGLSCRELRRLQLSRTQQQGLWHGQRKKNTSSLSWKTCTGFLWSIILTTRVFHSVQLLQCHISSTSSRAGSTICTITISSIIN